MNSATHIAARLIREGAVTREELPELDHPEIRREVEDRLEAVGLVLATSAYSDQVGIRLSPEVTADQAFDSATNLGLRADACALIVVLWARLVLQKRTAEDTRAAPGPSSLFAADDADRAHRFVPSVPFEALAREFGDVFASRTHLRRLLAQLRRLGFAAGSGDTIEAGPFLELGVDGEAMVAFIRRGVLARLAEERREAEDLPPSPEERILTALVEIDGPTAIGDLEEATGLSRPALRKLLKMLMEDGRVRREGERAATRYLLNTPRRSSRREEE